MNSWSLLASTAINLGLAFLILSLFSIAKKQPSNAPIYFAHPLSRRRHIPSHHHSFSRFLPSFSWIPRAFSVCEDDIIATSGLDALIIIRLFKFGINFFVACSLVGLLILLPVNYLNGPCSTSLRTDCFTISNINKGSNRLWLHYSCLCFASIYALYLLYKNYSEILEKRVQQLHHNRNQPNQFTVLVQEIPLCSEHKTRSCSTDHFFSRYHPHSYHSYQILYEGKYFENLLARSVTKKIEYLKEVTMVKEHEADLLEPLWGVTSKLRQHEEKLQELLHKIRHLQTENMLKQQELPVAFVTFKSRVGAALASQSQQHADPLLWITEMAPESRDVLWKNLEIPYKLLPVYKCGAIALASLLTIFFAVPVAAVQGIAKFEKLKKWFPPAMAVQFIPGLSSIVTGYLPSVILNGFIYTIPFAMVAMARLSGFFSRSKTEIKACNMVFYFLLGNLFFLSLLSGSLLDEIGESFMHPRKLPSQLARAVSGQADFFLTYILADGLSGFSLEILQPGLLLWDAIKSHTFGCQEKKAPYIYPVPYYRVIPFVSLSILIGMVYAVVSPLLLPFLVGYFCLGYAVYINQIEDVYETVYETYGQYWPCIHHYIVVAIVLTQTTMIGLFGLKSKPSASISTIPLLLLTVVFNEYCKRRFLPSFIHCSIQNAVDSDEADSRSGVLVSNYSNAYNAYCPPRLQALDFSIADSRHDEAPPSCQS